MKVINLLEGQYLKDETSILHVESWDPECNRVTCMVLNFSDKDYSILAELDFYLNELGNYDISSKEAFTDALNKRISEIISNL